MSTYYPVSSRSRLYSTHYQPDRSVFHSKTLNDFELSKPEKLVGVELSDSSISWELPENPFRSYSSFSMYQSRPQKYTAKENPFITATPYRHCPKEQNKERIKGLSAWQKQKYLQLYAQNQPQQELNGHHQADHQKREPLSVEGSKKNIRNNRKLGQNQEVKIQALMYNDQLNSGTFRKRTTFDVYEDDTISFKKPSPIDIKSKFRELYNEGPQIQMMTQKGEQKYDEDPLQNKSQDSLIDKLLKGAQPSPNLRINNSRVFEYQYGTDQTSFNRENTTQQRPKDFKTQSGLNVKIEDKYNFDEKGEGFYINKIRDFPSQITHKYVEYKMIKII